MYDFFISHSSIDKAAIVDSLVLSLENKGLNIWYDKKDILIGDEIKNTIQEGLQNSLCVILIITKNFLENKWVFWESGYFEFDLSKRLIPIIYDISEDSLLEITRLYGNIKYIDGLKNSTSDIAETCKEIYLKNKQSNNEYTIKKNFSELQRKYNSYENVGAGVICQYIKKHCDIYENHSDLLIFTAKKMIKAIILDYIEYYNMDIGDCNNITLNELINSVFKETVNTNIKNHFQYIARIEGENISKEENVTINKILISILSWYSTVRYPLTINSNALEIVYPSEFTQNDFCDMYEIDKLTMRNDLIADSNATYNWYKYNNYTHIALRDMKSNKIIGYFAALPVTEKTYDMLISGNFKDKDFTIKNIVQYTFPQFYKIYIAGVAIHPDYQNTNAFSKLFNALVDLFINLAKDREIFISTIIAEASTEQGEKLCKLVNMNKITNTVSGTDVFSLTLIPPEFKFNSSHSAELKRICEKKYLECQEYFE